MKKMTSQTYGISKSSAKKEVYSNTVYLKKQEKLQINNLTLYIKQLEREEKKNPLTVSRRKEIIKIRAEINEKEMKENIAKINKRKNWFFEKIKQKKHQADSSIKKGED